VELAPDFSEFFGLLDAQRAEYLVVGAYALALHGAPRFTGDIDVLIRPTLDNAGRVLDAIAAFGFPVAPLTPKRLCEDDALIEMGVPPVQIHVMSAISGVTWEAAWAGRVEHDAAGRRIPFIGRQELLANKRAAGRAKDLADLEALGESGP
jgi:hypothetical protein